MLMFNGEPFTTGSCLYHDDLVGYDATDSKLFIEVRVGTLEIPVFAMVDTGAPYCIFEPELLAESGYSFDRDTAIPLSTRFGPIRGSIHRVPLTLVANEGETLELDSTVFLPQSWKGNFIGFMGCLQRIRFAVDPNSNTFHFGKYAS